MIKKLLICGLTALALTACGSKENGNKANGVNSVNKVNTRRFDLTAGIDDIEKHYRNNPIGANKKYKGKRTKISGIIQEIDTSLGVFPYVGLFSEYSSSSTHLYFSRDKMDDLAELKRGHDFTAVCTIAGNIRKIPIIKDCEVFK